MISKTNEQAFEVLIEEVLVGSTREECNANAWLQIKIIRDDNTLVE